MLTLEELHAIGDELENTFCLRVSPIAVKLINRDEIPEGSAIPSAEGKHYALCQALSYVRRTRHSLALFAEDHWCLWPVINFRLRPLDEEDIEYVGTKYFIRDPEVSKRHFRAEYPYIREELKKDGMALAPLNSCAFEPDAVMIYCGPSQLRQLLMASKYDTGNITQSSFDTCDSCGAALVPVLNGEKGYNVSMPDAGEYERGLCTEDDMIYTISGANIEPFIGAVRDLVKKGFSYKQLSYDLRLEYRRAPFYNDMFRKWGLETGEEWTVGKR